MDFDQAPVCTIHGFCQRILQEHAFETANLFETDLAADPLSIFQEIAEDFWRRHVVPAPVEFVAYALARLSGPPGFLRLLEQLKAPGVCLPTLSGGSAFTHLEDYRAALQELRRRWPECRAEVVDRLNEPTLDARSYGALVPAGPAVGTTQRQERTNALVAGLEDFLNADWPGFPPYAGLVKLSSDFLAAKTRKRFSPPRSAFFDLCQHACACAESLEAEMARHVRDLKVRLIEYSRSELKRRKEARNLRSFDDLLVSLAQALKGPQGALLAESVRRRFKATLVDEFQDTDDLQVDILFGIFASAGLPLFLIGDPKQAIYGFRGADIFSYLKASRRSDAAYTLSANRRSTPGLVSAVNSLFGRRRRPFLIPGIDFVPASAVRSDAPTAGAPFVIWYLDSRRVRSDGKPAARSEAEPLIAAAVAGEIARCLQSGEDMTPAGDIAVLVRTNEQARLVKAALTLRRVPAVVCSAGDVFKCREADELERILAAIADPTDVRRIKAALATGLMGAAADEIRPAASDSPEVAERFRRMREYFQIWSSRGFMPMFRRLLSAEGIKRRILGTGDGDRRLTNLLHLGELLHQAEGEFNPGLSGLVKWLSLQRRSDVSRLEEHQLRLESDARAVQIVTIHKSKGLEYPVVFCPFAWNSSTVAAEAFLYHDPAADHRLTLALDGDSPEQLTQAENERLSENLRLLYVALTRARERCIFVWGRINGAETSAPAYLLHAPAGEEGEGAAAADDRPEGLVRRLSAALKAKSDPDLLDDLKVLENESAGAIEIRPVPEPGPHDAGAPADPGSSRLNAREFKGVIDRSWKTASYSLLVNARESAEGSDRGDEAAPQPPVSTPESEASGEAPAADQAAELMAFPRGSRAGNFFHAVLEKVDFSAVPSAAVADRVARALSDHRYESRWLDPVCRMIAELASRPLFEDAPGLTLAQVPAADRLAEMEFYYPLKRITPETLARAFRRLGPRDRAAAASDEPLGRLDFASLQGYMKGYIDLVFRFAGRFYLIDWKSNHLGDRPGDYHPRRLAACMLAERYVLQYHIYTLALHRYLALRLPGYRYAQHFGGVAYVFIRGIDPRLDPGLGVYTDRPDEALVQDLEEELIAGHE
jgi:exodeoxyribonuclease V beta subunit